MATRFVKLTFGPHLVGDKHCLAGSVVEVDDHRARHMVDAKVALFDDGPAFEAPPEPESEPEKKSKKAG